MDESKVARRRRASKRTVTVIALLLFTYPVLGTILPATVNAGTFLLGVGILVLWVVGTWGPENGRLHPVWMLWTFSGLLVLVGFIWAPIKPTVPISQAVLYLIAIFAALLFSIGYGWQREVLRILAILVGVHAAATISFALFPEMYQTVVQPVLYPDPRFNMDYRDALTPNRSQNAVFAGVGLILATNYLFSLGRGAKKRRLAWLAVGVFLIALLLTTVRGPLVYAAVVVLVVYGLLQRSHGIAKTAPVALGGAALISVIALTSEYVRDSLARLFDTFEEDDLSAATSGRLVLWEKALEGWREQPWFGNGWRTFQYTYPSGVTRELAHNQFLGSLYESGIVGTSLYVLAAGISLFIAIRGLRRAVKRLPGNLNTLFLASSTGVQLFYLLYGNTTGQLLSKPYTFVPYFIMIAVGFVSSNEVEDALSDLECNSDSARARSGGSRAVI